MQPLITDWLTAIGTVTLAFLTLILAVIAIFQDYIRSWLVCPKLDVSIDVKPPDCQKIRLHPDAENREAFVDAFYLRLKVKNQGNQQAEKVEVFAAKLCKQQADGEFKEVDSFLPLNLVWSHIGQLFYPSISPETYKHCDLAHVLDPQKRVEFSRQGEDAIWDGIPRENTILSFDTIVKPHTLSHLVPFGKYQLTILVAAANAKPIKKILEISLTGTWYSDEQRMLRDGIGIRVL